jgi:hypothetical protein
MGGRRSLAWGTLAVAAGLGIAISACVGSESLGSPTADGGADATGDTTIPEAGSAGDATLDAVPNEAAADTNEPTDASEAAADVSEPADASDAGPSCDLDAAFGVPTLVPGVNTNANERMPRVTPDELVMYFASDRGAVGGYDVYTATRTSVDAGFSGVALVPQVNSTSNEYDVHTSGDQRTLVLTSDRAGTTTVVYGATRTATNLDFLNLAPIAGIGGYGNGQPFLRADGLELWFFSGRPGSVGGSLDLWRAPGSGVSFSNPVAVTELNTSFNETGSWLTADGLTVYWTTTRTDGNAKGQGDIWRAHRPTPSSAFSGLVDVPDPLINTASDDNVGSLSSDACRLYFWSNRTGMGGYDIYVAERH